MAYPIAPLTTTKNVLDTAGVQRRDPPTLLKYELLRQGMEAAICDYLRYDPNLHTGVIDYYDGQGYKDIILRHPFIQSITNVWLNPDGAYGQAPGTPFPSSTLLVAGQDYVLVLDGDGGIGKSGLLRRLWNNFWWFPSDLFFGRKAGGLAYRNPAYWPVCYGGIKVELSYGFSAIPPAIITAVTVAVNTEVNIARYGYPVQSESLGGYNYSLAIQRDPAFGRVRDLLNPFRDNSIGLGLC
jgi:hypothetical protein